MSGAGNDVSYDNLSQGTVELGKLACDFGQRYSLFARKNRFATGMIWGLATTFASLGRNAVQRVISSWVKQRLAIDVSHAKRLQFVYEQFA